MAGVTSTRRRLLAGLASALGAAVVGGSGCRLFRSGGDETSELAWLDLRDASRALHSGRLSPVALARACLERIARLNPRLNAFITVTGEQALADARRAERELAAGKGRGPLHGIPIALKDNIDTAGVRTTAASAVFADRIPTADAEVVRRLKDAGAILIGKLNLHEFALGTTSAISNHGPVRNPWDPERSAGGSSGGCGAAVAAGMCFGAIGTDTGGSVRIPAAACGIVGLKPTYGVIGSGGVVPVSTAFDTVGPLGRTVADTAMMFRALTDHPVARACDPDAFGSASTLRIGRVRTTPEICDRAVDAEVQTVFDAAVEEIRSLVASMRDVELPMPAHLGTVIDAEAFAYHTPWLAAAPERYDARTKALIIEGEKIDAAEYARLRDELHRYRASPPPVFSDVDVVILPTLPNAPLHLRDAREPFALVACTFAFSIGGWPALSVPCGFLPSGLPVGLLMGGPALSEPHLFALANAYERKTGWHARRPPLE